MELSSSYGNVRLVSLDELCQKHSFAVLTYNHLVIHNGLDWKRDTGKGNIGMARERRTYLNEST